MKAERKAPRSQGWLRSWVFSAVGLLAWCSASVSHAATMYTNDGVLNARQEQHRWFNNRARFDPEKEADRLGITNTAAGGHPDYDCCEGMPNPCGGRSWNSWKASKPPVAPSRILNRAATNHVTDLALHDVLQHPSPSSMFYPINSEPWQRAVAEGYSSSVGENASWGHASGGAAHESLFRDYSWEARGHRRGILNNWTEVGIADHPFRHYEVTDYGNPTPDTHFFTDTIFYDSNTNGVYDEGEGIPNVKIMLFNGDTEHSWYDISTVSGNFAIPLDSLPAGRLITVKVTHSSSSPSISVPLGFSTLGKWSVLKSTNHTLGAFRQPSGKVNVGFRNMQPQLMTQKTVFRDRTLDLTFSTFQDVRCYIESSDTGLAGPWLLFGSEYSGMSNTVSFSDWGQVGRGRPDTVARRFYRAYMLLE